MPRKASGEALLNIVKQYFETADEEWLLDKITRVVREKSSRELFMSFSLSGSKLKDKERQWNLESNEVIPQFLVERGATELEVGRITLLAMAIESDSKFFVSKVQQLLQITDSKELVTILKYLVLLPESEKFKNAAVEALRTNISDVFDAIALNNPYPADYFNEQQWNQMYLKAAFMQRDLSKISGTDSRANKELARIISDYAHERWAASREIDPKIWRPVSNFLEGALLDDVKRLFESDNPSENGAAALVCHHSALEEAKTLLQEYPQHKLAIEQQRLTWNTI
ncbi:MAG: EboA domain-containing protein [Bacteroidota bacterium]